MEIFEVNILGCGSAKPTLRHLPSAQIVNMRGKYYMLDCGEGAQIQMQRMQLPMAKIGHIFISHNHGDHVFGLPGLISTMSLLGRTADLHVHAPEEVKPFLDTILGTYCDGIEFEVIFRPVDTHRHQKIFEDNSMEAWAIPLKHRVPCCGYLIREKQGLPHIKRSMIDAFHIPVSQINNIKAGASWTTEDGTLLTHEQLTTPAAPARTYAYCSDTICSPSIIPYINKVNLLYHEATFPHEMLLRAQQTMHTTAQQAAQIAKDACVGQLCIGHFSARITNEQILKDEACPIFPNTTIANEGMTIKL